MSGYCKIHISSFTALLNWKMYRIKKNDLLVNWEIKIKINEISMTDENIKKKTEEPIPDSILEQFQKSNPD